MEQHRPEPFGPPRVFTGQGESLPEPSVPPESPVGGWPVGSGPAESQVVRSESQPVGFGPAESQAVGSESQPVGSESQPIGTQPAEMLIPAPLPEKHSPNQSQRTSGSDGGSVSNSGAGSNGGSGLVFSKRLSSLLAIFIILALVAAGTALGVTLMSDRSGPSVTEVAREILVVSNETSDIAAEADDSQAETEGESEPTIGRALVQATQNLELSNEPENSEDDEEESLPKSLSPVVDKLLPTAVTIYYRIPDTLFGSTGSGVIYDEEGLIITAAHVVVLNDPNTNEIIDPEDAELLVELSNGEVVEAEIVGLDQAVDVALLRFDPTGLEFEVAKIGDVDEAKAGDVAIAIGSPYGLKNSVNVGFISALDRVARANFEPNSPIQVPAIQTDAPINSGNSGGMLANVDGEILGINVYIQTTRTTFGQAAGNLGIGFAVPIDLALRVVNKILLGEELVYGSLGITGTSNPQEGIGAEVVQVNANTAAARAGLQVGDRIFSYNSEKIVEMTDLISKVQFTEPGTRAVLGILRNGQEIEVLVSIDESEIESETLIYN